MMEYQGYIAEVEYDDIVKLYAGWVVNSGSSSIVIFETDNEGELERVFQEAIDEYLTWCAEDGVEPIKPQIPAANGGPTNMTLHENVENAIKHGRSVIRQHRYDLNEATTRYAIIDPILTALGWKLDDPNQCRFEEWRDRKGQEYSGQIDYCLYKNGKPLIVIEAKSLSKNMNEFSEENQLKRYNVNPDLWVLTNGSHWYFYKNRKDFGAYRFPDINIEYETVADDDKKSGREATIEEMAEMLIKELSYRRL